MNRHRSIVILVALLISMSGHSFGNTLETTLESYRTKLPVPEGWKAARGVSFIDKDGAIVPVALLRQLGTRLVICGIEDLYVLASYLRDPDGKIAFIAACRLNAALTEAGLVSAAPPPNPKHYLGSRDTEALNAYATSIARLLPKLRPEHLVNQKMPEGDPEDLSGQQ